jgi:hypothetical protein
MKKEKKSVQPYFSCVCPQFLNNNKKSIRQISGPYIIGNCC